jgi:integrase
LEQRVFLRRIFGRSPTFEELARQILEEKKLRAKNTYASARVQLFRLIDHFGPARVSSITEQSWNHYVGKRREKDPACRLFDDRKYMRQVLLLAYRQHHLARKVKLWIPDLPSAVGREITAEEIDRLSAKAPPELLFQMEIALKMGLRLREMLHLRWDQIDWTRRTVKLQPADTKTRRGREVPINADLLDRFTMRYAGAGRSPFVFPSPKNPTKPQHNNKRSWRRCKREAMVRCRWHDWRHTCATLMLRRGASISATRKFLGMSETVLQNIYQHLDLDDLRRAGALLSDVKAG